jgi:hypothetical protein
MFFRIQVKIWNVEVAHSDKTQRFIVFSIPSIWALILSYRSVSFLKSTIIEQQNMQRLFCQKLRSLYIWAFRLVWACLINFGLNVLVGCLDWSFPQYSVRAPSKTKDPQSVDQLYYFPVHCSSLQNLVSSLAK